MKSDNFIGVDENEDGIPDVLQRTQHENLSRRFYIFMRSVDPDQVTDALVMLWSATLTVIGTVLATFAAQIPATYL